MRLRIQSNNVSFCFGCRQRTRDNNLSTLQIIYTDRNTNKVKTQVVKLCDNCKSGFSNLRAPRKKGYHFCKVCLKLIQKGRKKRHYQTKGHIRNLLK